MGKASRDKGANYERELVNAFREGGIDAQRVPLSGATSFAKNDIQIDFRLGVWDCEAKRRKSPPKFFTEALDGADFAAFRQDRGETLIVLTLDKFVELVK